MEIQDNHLKLRIAVATVLVMVGAAFISRLPQLLPGQQIIPWYNQGFFRVGIVIIILALTILIVPSRFWAYIGRYLHYSPNAIRKFYLWMYYGPNYTISNPVIETLIVDNISPLQIHYKAQFSLDVKNKGKPIKLNLNGAKVLIRQETDWNSNRLAIGNLTGINEVELKPYDKGHWDIIVATSPRSGVILNPPDLQKPYIWGVQGIFATLPKAGIRELHKGLYYIKPQREIRIGVW